MQDCKEHQVLLCGLIHVFDSWAGSAALPGSQAMLTLQYNPSGLNESKKIRKVIEHSFSV